MRGDVAYDGLIDNKMTERKKTTMEVREMMGCAKKWLRKLMQAKI